MATQYNLPKPFQKYKDGSKEGKYTEPRHDIDPHLKDDKWCRKYAESILAKFLRDSPVLAYSEKSEMAVNRLYSRGMQSIMKYMDILVPPETDASGTPVNLSGLEARRKGYMNVNWEIFSFMPKFKSVVMGIFEDVDYDAKACAIDEVSGAEREDMKFNLWYESQHKALLAETRANLGLPQQQTEYLPATLQELDLFQNLGGIKLKSELGIERGLKYCFYLSDWAEMKRKMIEDIFENNKCASKDYYDAVTGKVKCRYVDIARLVHQYSSRRDYKNIDWAGEIVPYTLGQLREESNMTEDQLIKIGRQYIGYMDNVADEDSYKRLYSSPDLTGQCTGLNDFKIEVLDCEWVTYNHKMRTKSEEMYGWDYAGNKKDKKEGKNQRQKVRLKMIYRCKLVIGTDHVFDWGPQNDIPRPTKKEANLSYHIYALPGRSMVNMSIQNIDQIQLTFLKLQNALAKAKHPGISVEIGSLMNMKIGGKAMEPLDILEIHTQTGDLLWKATTHKGMPNAYMGDPVKPLQGGIGTFLEECIALFEFNLQCIRDITGITQFADASTPNKNQPVATAKMALAGTNNALKSIFVAVASVKERVAVNAASRIQMRIKYTKEAYEAYLPILGSAQLQVFKISPDDADAVFGIMVELRPTEEMKRETKQAALEMSVPGQDGQVQISGSDYLMICDYIDRGEVRYAQALLAYKEKLNKEQQQKIAAENIQRQNEGLAQIEKTKQQGEQAKIAAETAAAKDIDAAKTDNLIRLEAVKHEFKLQEIEATPRPTAAPAK